MMRLTSFLLCLLITFLLKSNSISGANFSPEDPDDVTKFKTLLKTLSDNAGNDLFAIHYQSIIDVIEAKSELSFRDSILISETIPVFSDKTSDGFAGDSIAYFERMRSLTIAWASPTDGAVSFFRLKLPKDWEPGKNSTL